MDSDIIIGYNDPVLVTGASGFIGVRVVDTLLRYGFQNLRCFVRPSSNLGGLEKVINTYQNTDAEIVKGNLLSKEDCKKATENITVIFHLAAGIGKSFSGCFLNSVVSTRNLLDEILHNRNFKRFLNVSSFAVYSNRHIKRGGLLDETCEIVDPPEERGEAYCYGKVKQDELLFHYNRQYKIPYVIVRPGAVYGPGKNAITGRVGIDTFGIFLHLGGSNKIPFTYVDNCAEAIVLAGIKKGIDGETFNIMDDDIPESRTFLKLYKQNVRWFKSISLPYRVTYMFSLIWEKYSKWSEGQLPPVFNRSRCEAEWKGNEYSNQKLKALLGWKPRISTREGFTQFFKYAKEATQTLND